MAKTNDPEELRYRWVILAASYLVRFLLFGNLYCVGVLYVEWLAEFQTSKGDTAWIGSLATGTTLLVGPLGSEMIRKVGTRKTIVLGGIILSSGLILSVFAPNIYYLFFTYGILAGTGGGLANLGAIVGLTDYFKRQQAFAMGVGCSGSGLGAFLFSMLLQYLLQEYGWRGSLLIISGISLNICVAGFLMIHPRHLPGFVMTENTANVVSSDEKSQATDRTVHETETAIYNSDITSPQCLGIDHNIAVLTEGRRAENCDSGVSPKNHVNSLMSEEISNKFARSPKRRKSSFYRKILSRMKFTDLTVALWRDPVFLLLFASDFMSWLVQYIPFVHLPERARLLGVSPLYSAVLVSCIGLSAAVGKFALGAICTFLKLDPLRTFIFAQTLFGASTILSPLCVTFEWLLVYAISFGFLSGAYTLMMVIPADLLGKEKFSASYGFLLAGEGIGVYLGPPIAGWIADASSSYEASFYCAGAVLLASGVILLLNPCISKSKQNHSDRYETT